MLFLTWTGLVYLTGIFLGYQIGKESADYDSSD